jgi:hypothetical protein
MRQRYSLIFIVYDKYKDISTNTWSGNILFYQHPYNNSDLIVQLTSSEKTYFLVYSSGISITLQKNRYFGL